MKDIQWAIDTIEKYRADGSLHGHEMDVIDILYREYKENQDFLRRTNMQMAMLNRQFDELLSELGAEDD